MNIQEILKIYSVVTALSPFIINIVKDVESVVGASGLDKKAAVLQAIRDGFTSIVGGVETVSTGGQLTTWQELEKPLGLFIDTIVGVFNSMGIFNKTATQPVVTTEITAQ